MLRRIAELARGFLLQGRGGERRRGVALDRLGLDAFDREASGLDSGFRLHRDALLAKTELLQLVAPELDEARIELGAVVHHSRDD